MAVGIIAEYNPFHNGHIYHLKKVKELFPHDDLILVMSGDLTQRGEISLINKWDKTEIALKYGVDLVVELPIACAIQAADIFAYGAIETLHNLKVDKIVFGSEKNDKNLLIRLAKIQLSKEYKEVLKKYVKQNSYPKACSLALLELTNIEINTPNDLLGLSYTKEIIKNNYPIDIVTIKRTNDYHSTTLQKISSATSIRKAIKDHIDIKDYVPLETIDKINENFTLENYYSFIKYKIIATDDLTIFNDVDEKIANRIKKYINGCLSLDELISKAKSKNYTYNKLKRIFLFILFDIKKDIDKNIKYIRVLGFNNKGKKYLNKVKKDIKLPIITNYSNSKGLLKLDYKIKCILALNINLDNQRNFIDKEIKEVIRKIDD